MLWPLLPLAIGAVVLGYLEWPVPLLSRVLGETVGHAEPFHFPTPMGLIAGALGLAGFFLMAWRTGQRPGRAPATAARRTTTEHYDEPLEPSVAWSTWLSDLSYGIANRIARFQSGHLSRYILVSVLGIAAILLLTLTVGVSQPMTGPR